MSKFKLNIQLFGDGGANWTEGVSKAAIQNTVAEFDKKISDTVAAINNTQSLEATLAAGWSGQDRVDYMEKFHKHAANIIKDIEKYQNALHKTIDDVIEQWERFQKGLIK